MAYSVIALKDLTELKSRRGNPANTTLATILGLNYPVIEAYTVYAWDETSIATPDDNEIVEPTIGGITTGRWYKIELNVAPQVNADWSSTSGLSMVLNKPIIPPSQVNCDWNAISGAAQVLNKPTIPSSTSQLTNDSGYITGITSTNVTNALGFVPYNIINPAGYITVASARSGITLTTIGTGSSTYNSTTGALNIPIGQSLTAGTNISIISGAINNTAPDQVVSLSGSNGITSTGTYPNFTITKSKRQETYSGVTNPSGVYAVTFTTAYSVAPNVQVEIVGGVIKLDKVTSVTTTGFSILVQLRNDVLGLLPTYTNVTNQAVDVLITEK